MKEYKLKHVLEFPNGAYLQRKGINIRALKDAYIFNTHEEAIRKIQSDYKYKDLKITDIRVEV